MGMTLVTDGARLLRSHLQSTGETVPAFSERAGLNRIYVQRGLSGEQQRFSLDFALAVERACGRDASGEPIVPASSWSSDTLRPEQDWEGRVHPRVRAQVDGSATPTEPEAA